MRFLDTIEAKNWATKQGFVLDGDRPTVPTTCSELPLTTDTGKRISLCRALWAELASSDETLIWFTGWSVWPSCEHMPLFESLRVQFGERRPISKIPAQIVAKSELSNGLSLLITGCLFLWDTWILSGQGNSIAFISHDEFVKVSGVSASALGSLKV